MSMDQLVRLTPDDLKQFMFDLGMAIVGLVAIAILYSVGFWYSAYSMSYLWREFVSAGGQASMNTPTALGILLIFRILTGSFVKVEDAPTVLFMYPSLAILFGLLLKNVV